MKARDALERLDELETVKRDLENAKRFIGTCDKDDDVYVDIKSQTTGEADFEMSVRVMAKAITQEILDVKVKISDLNTRLDTEI